MSAIQSLLNILREHQAENGGVPPEAIHELVCLAEEAAQEQAKTAARQPASPTEADNSTGPVGDEALRESYALLRAVTDGVDDAVFVKDAQSRYRMINIPGAHRLGKAVDEVLGRDDWGLMDPEAAEQARAQDRQVMAEGRTVRFEDTRSVDGITRTYLTTKVPHRDAHGRTIGVLGISHDITERKAAEEAARETSERLRLAIEGSQGAEWEIPVDPARPLGMADKLRNSPRHKAFLGLGDDELPNTLSAWLERIHPDDLAAIEASVQAHTAGRAPYYRSQYRIRRKDGDWCWISSTGRLYHDSTGKPARWVGMDWDITEQKCAEEALRTSEARFRSVLESMSEGLMLFDAGGNLIYQNPASLRIHGFDARQTGKIEHERLPATWDAWDEVGQAIRFDQWPVSRVFRHERFQNQVLHVRRVETGHEFDGSYNGCPIYGPEGKLSLGFITIRDITEQVRALKELRQLKDQLEARVEQRTVELAAANRELEAFGYTVSHDLRAPLRHVVGFVELLKDHTQASLDEEGREYLDTIAKSADRMGHLIDDLLMLSRLGRATISRTDVDLRCLVDEAVAELAPAITGRAIAWRIGSLPRVHGDRTLLRNAVVNLISNAVKYSRDRSPARIEIGSELRDGEIVCHVRDNGAGFDMQFVDKLFGVFQRLHAAEEFEGTGIGLASVRRIIQRHGGRVWAEGAVDEGATFYFTLPKGAVLDQ